MELAIVGKETFNSEGEKEVKGEVKYLGGKTQNNGEKYLGSK